MENCKNEKAGLKDPDDAGGQRELSVKRRRLASIGIHRNFRKTIAWGKEGEEKENGD